MHLEWLKGIKDLHGSVEKSSLRKAQQINSSGTYVISGKSQIPTVENSLEALVEDESGWMAFFKIYEDILKSACICSYCATVLQHLTACVNKNILLHRVKQQSLEKLY